MEETEFERGRRAMAEQITDAISQRRWGLKQRRSFSVAELRLIIAREVVKGHQERVEDVDLVADRMLREWPASTFVGPERRAALEFLRERGLVAPADGLGITWNLTEDGRRRRASLIEMA